MYANEEYGDSQIGYDYNYGGDYDGHTGDPHLDMEYDRQYSYKVPDVVNKFITYLHKAISEGMIFEIQNLYENMFPKLTEQFFDKRPWPEESDIAPLVDNDRVFLILYKELYYRHIYARIPGGPTFEQRVQSFYNYCDFFNCILNGEQPVALELPDLWLWELVDEFVYQFQTFAQYRARGVKRTTEEIEALNQNKLWNVFCVLNVLHSLVDKSNIKKQLEVYASGGDPDSVAGDFGRHSLYKMLGYFSLVGLLRLHSLLGDYYQAIKVLENMEIHKKYSHVPACQITTSYYVGFAYMMMRRYADAIQTFSAILLYIQRTKQLFQTRSYQNDQINKQTDQMYTLLAICLVLHPMCVDESIQQSLRERNFHEKMYKMQYGDLQEFEQCFNFGCPKFLSPSANATETEDSVKEAMKHQTNVFMDEVRQQKMLPTIRSYLKLYTTLPVSKLATFMAQQARTESTAETGANAAATAAAAAASTAVVPKIDLPKETEQLIIHLLCFKHKMKNLVWSKGASGLEGHFQSGSELDFYIDHDMIHIADTKVAHKYGEFFIRKILKFEELHRKIKQVKI